ncbi:X-ray repair cross-complementing protein 5 [Sparganum proliferum]
MDEHNGWWRVAVNGCEDRLASATNFLSQSKEQFSLVLAGTEATANELADEDGNFANISLIRELAPFDWDILELLNMIDAIFVGVDHLMKKAKIAKGKPEKHVLLVSNLEGETDVSQLDEVIDRLQKAEVLLNLIGLRLPPGGDNEGPLGNSAGPSTSNSAPTDSDGKSFTGAMLQRVQAFGQILDALDGESFDFTDAIPALALFETRGVSQRAWKAALTIGDSFSIPVAGYSAVREARPPPMRDMYAPDPSIPVRAVTTYHLNDELQTPVDISDTVRAYRYGASLVPFSDEDMEKIKEPEEKCFSVVGFTRSENVPRHLYVGNSVMFFVADTPTRSADTGSTASAAFSALAQALFELDAVALVRRVYSRSTAPVLGVLTPRIQATSTVLVYYELAFQQDIRTFTFNSLPVVSEPSSSEGVKGGASQSNSKHRPSPEQLAAMEKFVDAMTIMGGSDDESDDGENDDEANASGPQGDQSPSISGLHANVTPERIPNPWIQRLFTCVRERGLASTTSVFSTAAALPSQATSDRWPTLDTTNLPGLESVLQAVGSALSEPSSELRRALRELNQLLPEVVPVDSEVVPSKKRPSEEDENERIKKKRRAMASELFGISAEPAISELCEDHPGSLNPFASQAVAVTHVGSVDPISDFNALISASLHETASRQLEEHIYRLVDDPLTSSLLRPKVVLCLRGYRKAAGESVEVGRAYNRFLHSLRAALENPPPGDQVAPNRLALWTEVISPDPLLAPVSDTDLAGVGLSAAEAQALVREPLRSVGVEAHAPATSTTDSAALDNLLDDLE